MKNRYEVRGETTAIFLKLKDGSTIEALIDTEHLDVVSAITTTWHACYQKDVDSYYAQAYKYGKRDKCIMMHRLVMSVDEWKVKVDHINHNTLDNRKENLRKVSNAENHQNRKGPNSNTRSGVRGVYWKQQRQKWAAQVKVNYKPHFLGYFETIEEAKNVVEQARKQLMPFA